MRPLRHRNAYPTTGALAGAGVPGTTPPAGNNDEYERIVSMQHMIDRQSSEILSLREEIDNLMMLFGKDERVPEQFHAGVVAYPDRYPFPMVLDIELLTQGRDRYGVTNEIVQALIKVDVDNPTFLTEISFDLYKTTDFEQNTGLVGVYLPLGFTNSDGLFDPALGFVYQGRDFRWRVQTDSDDRLWQTGWRASAQLNFQEGMGYKLPLEYELRRNDSLIIQAQPIAAPLPEQEAQEYALTANLHIYKMLLKQEREG